MRLIVADDSALLRQGIARLLTDRDYEIVAEAASLDEVLVAARTHDVDAIVTDLKMPPNQSDEGFRIAAEMRDRGVGVIVISQYSEPEYAQDLLTRGGGGVGYLLKESIDDISRLDDAIRRVALGECVIDEVIIRELVTRGANAKLTEKLTPRELEILERMAEGRSNEGIARVAYLSPKTVENYIGRIFEKLGLPSGSDDHRRVRAVLEYLRG